MSNQTSETVSGGPASVTKTVERQGNRLVVKYGLVSTGDESVDVRLTDRIPTENVGNLGFHEAYAPPNWSTDDGELELRATLEPDAERTFVFGAVAADDTEVPYEPSDPALHVENDDTGDEDTGDEDVDASGFFDEPASSTDESIDDAGDDAGDDAAAETATEDDAAETVNVADDTDTDADIGDAPDDAETADAPDDNDRNEADAASPPPDEGSILGALLAELDGDAATEAERAELREHLDVDRSKTDSVRLDYVQQRMSDFDAYVDALEGLLSVHGSGADAFAEFDDRLSALESDVEELSGTVETTEADLESLRTTHDEAVADVREELQRRESAVREDVDDVHRALESEITSLREELERLEAMRRALAEDLRLPDETDGERSVTATPDTGVETAADGGASGVASIDVGEVDVDVGEADVDAPDPTTNGTDAAAERTSAASQTVDDAVDVDLESVHDDLDDEDDPDDAAAEDEIDDANDDADVGDDDASEADATDDDTTEANTADDASDSDATDETSEVDTADDTSEVDTADDTSEVDTADDTSEVDTADDDANDDSEEETDGSIFDVGDSGGGGGRADDTPTIDFEDT